MNKKEIPVIESNRLGMDEYHGWLFWQYYGTAIKLFYKDPKNEAAFQEWLKNKEPTPCET